MLALLVLGIAGTGVGLIRARAAEQRAKNEAAALMNSTDQHSVDCRAVNLLRIGEATSVLGR